MSIKELLPVGSVVLLKNGTKRLSVVGIKQTDNTTDTEYDYIGVLYPEGFISESGQYLFNHDDVDEVYFVGYSDDEREGFLEKLDQFYTQQEALEKK